MDEAGDLTRQIERSMLSIRRGMSRRTLGQVLTTHMRPAVSLSVLAVIDTVEQSSGDGAEVVSVGTVARQMAIDPSRASRLVAEAIEAGYVRRVACQSDGRRTGLELTPAAGPVTEQAHRIRREYYQNLMSGWTPAEQRTFSRLLARFTDAMSNT